MQVSGAYEQAQIEKARSHLSHGRTPFLPRRGSHQYDSEPQMENMTTSTRFGVLAAFWGSFFVVGYAAVLTALPHNA